MRVTALSPAGLLLLEPDCFGDERGFFMEVWNEQRYAAAGLGARFVQDNLSFSRRGTLRGLHFQNPAGQGKLVMVLAGDVYDVAVDLRRSSPTFGRWHAEVLSATNRKQFYVPPGFAHGFQVLSETALFCYKCTEFYNPKAERAIRWNDSEVGIQWPMADPLLSPKDAAAPLLRELRAEELFA